MKPQIKDRKSVNVLPNQGSHIPQRAVLDEYGAIAVS
jgi:hypothetical protein